MAAYTNTKILLRSTTNTTNTTAYVSKVVLY